jgi:hypothetical protein
MKRLFFWSNPEAGADNTENSDQHKNENMKV